MGLVSSLSANPHCLQLHVVVEMSEKRVEVVLSIGTWMIVWFGICTPLIIIATMLVLIAEKYYG